MLDIKSFPSKCQPQIIAVINEWLDGQDLPESERPRVAELVFELRGGSPDRTGSFRFSLGEPGNSPSS